MMDIQKFNEYEQREAKNFILLESGKEDSSKPHFVLSILTSKVILHYLRIQEASPEVADAQSP